MLKRKAYFIKIVFSVILRAYFRVFKIIFCVYLYVI